MKDKEPPFATVSRAGRKPRSQVGWDDQRESQSDALGDERITLLQPTQQFAPRAPAVGKGEDPLRFSEEQSARSLTPTFSQPGESSQNPRTPCHCPCYPPRRGNTNRAATPPSGAFPTVTLPPCSCMISFTTLSPSPELFFPVSGRCNE